jgi:5-methylcytosine-specific restriction endonuclease McrA
MRLIDSRERSTALGISKRQARLLQCTAEHLQPLKSGGATNAANIVAACWYCNSRRHRRKDDLSPEEFKCWVLRRLQKKRWHHISQANRQSAIK